MSRNSFSKESEEIIIKYMAEQAEREKKIKNPFAELSKLIPHNHKQICQHWYEKLDPRLCKLPFNDNEKDFIYKWVKEHPRNDQGNIPWKKLQPEMEKEFGRLRATRDMKNIWNAENRRLLRQKNNVLDHLLPEEIDEIDE